MGDSNKDTSAAPTTDKMNAVDKAIKAAQARKAAKDANAKTNGEDPSAAPEAARAPKEKKPKLTDEEKAAKKKADDEAKAARKEERRKAREESKAKREADRKTPHMSKVARAAEKLPTLGNDAQLAFNNITTSLSRNDITALATHLQHFNRVQATERALGRKLEVGQRVRIISGESRFTGSEATVSVVQRIRCYVSVPGVKKDVYLFISDVEPVAEESSEVARKAS